jgi:hypothetical protein
MSDGSPAGINVQAPLVIRLSPQQRATYPSRAKDVVDAVRAKLAAAVEAEFPGATIQLKR